MTLQDKGFKALFKALVAKANKEISYYLTPKITPSQNMEFLAFLLYTTILEGSVFVYDKELFPGEMIKKGSNLIKN